MYWIFWERVLPSCLPEPPPVNTYVEASASWKITTTTETAGLVSCVLVLLSYYIVYFIIMLFVSNPHLQVWRVCDGFNDSGSASCRALFGRRRAVRRKIPGGRRCQAGKREIKKKLIITTGIKKVRVRTHDLAGPSDKCAHKSGNMDEKPVRRNCVIRATCHGGPGNKAISCCAYIHTVTHTRAGICLPKTNTIRERNTVHTYIIYAQIYIRVFRAVCCIYKRGYLAPLFGMFRYTTTFGYITRDGFGVATVVVAWLYPYPARRTQRAPRRAQQ